MEDSFGEFLDLLGWREAVFSFNMFFLQSHVHRLWPSLWGPCFEFDHQKEKIKIKIKLIDTHVDMRNGYFIYCPHSLHWQLEGAYTEIHDWKIEGWSGKGLGRVYGRFWVQVPMETKKDVMSWRVSKKDIFTVKSFFSSLAPCIGREFPSSLVWNPWVPKGVSFFAWEAIWRRILTMDQLKRRGWALSSRCYLCKADEESANHVLIHCPKAAMIWHLNFALFGVHWVLPNSIKETILGWNGTFVGKKRKKAWNAAPLCLFWTLWNERNKRIFEDTELADQAILRSFLYMFSGWVRVQ